MLFCYDLNRSLTVVVEDCLFLSQDKLSNSMVILLRMLMMLNRRSDLPHIAILSCFSLFLITDSAID